MIGNQELIGALSSQVGTFSQTRGKFTHPLQERTPLSQIQASRFHKIPPKTIVQHT